MHPIAHALMITWKRNGAYAMRLLADVPHAQFCAQPPGLAPAPLLNHPAWILSHLNVYAPICLAMLRRQSFADPIDHPYGQRSEVSADPAAYSPPAHLLAEFTRLHDDALHALEHAPDAVFADPNPLERARAMHPSAGDMLVTLMIKHESHHLGQLSAWRRAMGLARVAM